MLKEPRYGSVMAAHLVDNFSTALRVGGERTLTCREAFKA
jgi:hypothetical protein